MPKVKPETLAARRDEILEAAEICFARQGFHQTTIQHVIRESGLSAGCIYGHFASKEDLIQAMGERRHRHDAALLSATEEGQNPLQALRAIAQAFLRDLEQEPALRTRRIGLQLWAEALRSEEIRSQVTTGIHRPIAAIADLVLRGQRLGLIVQDLDPHSFARILVAMFQGLVLQRLWGEPFDAVAALRTLDILLAGATPK
jgi:AcrR family transcriptional regulator